MSHFDPGRLLRAKTRLGDAAIDPAIWPEIMQEICSAVGSVGAALLQSDVRTPDIPATAGVAEGFNSYFANGWHNRDVRAERAVPLLLGGVTVISDQDILTPNEMRRSAFYQEHLPGVGLRWFAVVGFQAGTALWGLSIQRTAAEGPFQLEDTRALGELANRLTEVATLSKAVGGAVLAGMTNALNLVKQPALALDRMGCVLEMNAAVERIFDAEICVRNRRLVVRDQSAKSQLDRLIDQLRVTADAAPLLVTPIVVPRRLQHPIIIRVLPVDSAARSPFLGARALLVLSDLNRSSTPQTDAMAKAFGLSPAEVRLAAIIADGISPDQAAEHLGIARATA